MSEHERARVFISCGQREDSGEVAIAEEIERMLISEGYQPYIACKQQSLDGLKENIFRNLAESEYFLFIDYRREELASGSEKGEIFRGSLFSHQELAIASYLGLEVLAFREDGVIKLDGIVGFVLANFFPFSNRRDLPHLVMNKIAQDKRWDPHWRNELSFAPGGLEFIEREAERHNPSRYYQIAVNNLHREKTARECVAYVDRIVDLSTGKIEIPDLVELKWSGVITREAVIPAKKSRLLDAFHVSSAAPKVARIGINRFIVDSTRFRDTYDLTGAGDFEIDYVVCSREFAALRSTFILHLGNRLEDIEFRIKSKQRRFVTPEESRFNTMGLTQDAQSQFDWDSIKRYPANPSGGTANFEL